MKKHGAFWMHLYPLLLFAIIVLSLLFLVMTGTGLYSAVVDSQTRNREARAALSYLAARVHAADAAGAVSVGEGPEGAALLLRENADGETYETRIYLYEGALREEYGTADAALDPQDSERIVDAKSFSVEQVRPGLLVVVGFSAVALFSILPAADASGAENPGALFLICAGLVAAVALVLPGISVSYLLLMMDMYNTVIQSISRLYLPYLLPLGAGVLLGIILTTKLLERAMEKHPQQTYLLILGFVLGSLPELFPGFPVSVPQWLMCLFSLALGGGAIWLLSSQEA